MLRQPPADQTFALYYNVLSITNWTVAVYRTCLLNDLLAVNDVETLAELRNIVAEIASVDRVNALNRRLVVHLNVLYASSSRIGYEYFVEEVALLALEGNLHLAVTLDSGREVAPCSIRHCEAGCAECAAGDRECERCAVTIPCCSTEGEFRLAVECELRCCNLRVDAASRTYTHTLAAATHVLAGPSCNVWSQYAGSEVLVELVVWLELAVVAACAERLVEGLMEYIALNGT